MMQERQGHLGMGSHQSACTTCRIELSQSSFGLKNGQPRRQCKSCVNASNRRSREKKWETDPNAYSALMVEYNKRVRSKRGPKREAELQRKYRLKMHYELTVDEFDAILQSQGGLCAICRGNADAWAIDHNHTTNKVRGILCASCNLGLGQFRDDPARLEAAISYLRKHANA